MTKKVTFKSTFGILDVERGRKALRKRIKKDGPIRVYIEADITGPFGGDDGTSIEFELDIIQVVEKYSEVG